VHVADCCAFLVVHRIARLGRRIPPGMSGFHTRSYTGHQGLTVESVYGSAVAPSTPRLPVLWCPPNSGATTRPGSLQSYREDM
jgi:hypothetical protein